MEWSEIIKRVCRAIDIIVDTADQYNGLFPSLIDRHTGIMLTHLPPAIPGQRQNDRSHLGSNLIHDEALLKTMYALAKVEQRPDYAAAADKYLRFFATNCTNTTTGLFPWGEHAYWNLQTQSVGSSYLIDKTGHIVSPDDSHYTPYYKQAIHDQLRQAPIWLWQKLSDFNPACVQRFAAGLDYHWVEGEPLEYIRHAYIEVAERHHRQDRSCDFPRHGGFYILDWAYAYQQRPQLSTLQQIERMLDYWWEKRDERGLLLIESRSPVKEIHFHNINAPGQTISLAASLLESAALLDASKPALAATMRERAHVYIEGFLAAPHDTAQGIFALFARREDNMLTERLPIWGSAYGVWPASYTALTCLCIYRIIGDMRLLSWAQAVARQYAALPFPLNVAVPAMDSGLALGLFADLFDLTKEAHWLEKGHLLADELVTRYCDAPLPRGAAGVDWYESQMGPSFLLHGLTRLALLAQEGPGCPLEADYTAR